MATSVTGAGITFPDSSTQTSSANNLFGTFHNVTSSRSLSTTYTNTSGKPMMVVFTGANNGSNSGMYMTVNGSTVANAGGTTQSGGYVNCYTLISVVPVGGTYLVSSPTAATAWYEIY
jgi:hypothetical protein